MNEKERMDNTGRERDRNEDPITGSPGAHPVGTGIGAAAGAAAGAAGTAAVGAAVGTAIGPVGTVIGGAVGAVIGGLAGKATAESVNPTEEEAYWREHHNEQPYNRSDYTFDDYLPGYRAGYEGYAQHGSSGKTFEQVEPEFRSQYDQNRGTSRLAWDDVRPAARAAWQRLDSRRMENYINWEVVDKNDSHIGNLECAWSDTDGQPAYIGVKTGWFFGKTYVVPAHSVQISEPRQRVRLPYDEAYVKNAPAYDSAAEMTLEKEEEVCRYYGVGSNLQPQNQEQPSMPGTAQPPRQNVGPTRQATEPSPEQATIQLSEEKLRVSKREVEAGGVRLRKIVRTEVVNQPVELQRDEIVIERVSPEEAHTGRQASFNEQEVYIPLRREEAVVEKETVLREEVRARKRQQTDRQEVSQEVRREDIEVENAGEARTVSRGKKATGTPAEEIREREEQPRSLRRREP